MSKHKHRKKENPRELDYIIFTDGSVRSPHGTTEKSYAGFGVVIYNTHTHQYASFGGELGQRSIVYTELWAIYKGLVTLSDMLPDYGRHNILVLSDSKLCVDSINVDCYTWESHADSNGVWYKDAKHKEITKNQTLFKRILSLKRHNPNRLNIQVRHIRSHLDLKKKASRYTQIEKLVQYGYGVSEEAAKAIIHMNALADQIATYHSQRLVDAERAQEFYHLRPTENYYIG